MKSYQIRINLDACRINKEEQSDNLPCIVVVESDSDTGETVTKWFDEIDLNVPAKLYQCNGSIFIDLLTSQPILEIGE